MNPGANTAEDRIRLYSGVRFRTLVCANGPACIFPPRVIVPMIRWRDGRCSGADVAEEMNSTAKLVATVTITRLRVERPHVVHRRAAGSPKRSLGYRRLL